jgi:hypothetical protein
MHPSLFLTLIHPLIHELRAYKEKEEERKPFKGIMSPVESFFEGPYN